MVKTIEFNFLLYFLSLSLFFLYLKIAVKNSNRAQNKPNERCLTAVTYDTYCS
jgi:hypothetical protein